MKRKSNVRNQALLLSSLVLSFLLGSAVVFFAVLLQPSPVPPTFLFYSQFVHKLLPSFLHQLVHVDRCLRGGCYRFASWGRIFVADRCRESRADSRGRQQLRTSLDNGATDTMLR